MPAAWRLRLVPSLSLHAAAFAIVMFGGDVFHRAHAVPQDRHAIAGATMRAWLPPASPEPLKAIVQERREPAVVRGSTDVVKRGADVVKNGAEAVKSGADPSGPRQVVSAKPEPQPAPFDPLGFVPPSSPPPVSPPPSDENVSVLFVGIENGEWLHWLAERHGVVGFTTRRDDVIEHVYSVSGEPLSTSSVAVATMWALELTQPERVTAIAGMLERERQRAGDADGRIRVFALFPASFRDEVGAAIHRVGGSGAFLVSFSGNELQVVASTPVSLPVH